MQLWRCAAASPHSRTGERVFFIATHCNTHCNTRISTERQQCGRIATLTHRLISSKSPCHTIAPGSVTGVCVCVCVRHSAACACLTRAPTHTRHGATWYNCWCTLGRGGDRAGSGLGNTKHKRGPRHNAWRPQCGCVYICNARRPQC